ncbi:hemicentin-2-like isoform X2 [Macrobrachium nipponense]|uniref:hemicentin-2-like isoform X2 n=1 Tax=Macrobrachium nipponense TaxID=159736 RepID=UPI0030C7DBC9
MLVVFLLSCWMALLDVTQGEVPRSSGPLSEVVAIEGGSVTLPCNITPPSARDSPILVLFYNGVTGMPVYSIDARNGPLETSIHWSELGLRARFDTASSPQGLVLQNVTASDDGDYRCRVDFGSSPTRNLRVKLMVVVPPRRISITNQSGLELSGIIGPYPVKGKLTLTCQTTGGKPKPQITWWHGTSLLDEVMEYSEGEIATNMLTLPNLSRQHLFRLLTCNATNSNMSRPLSASVTLDMTFPPMEVRILENNSPLSEGQKYKMVCEAMGSRPPASLTWYLDGVQVPNSKDQILHDGNMTRSIVYIEPSRNDNGEILSCRADNPLLEGGAVEDAKKLNVYYSPKLQLHTGLGLDVTNIKEGDDIYFECNIQANPPVSKVQWFLDGRELEHNKTFGVIQSNMSLVLQKLSRNSSGFYTCRGTNVQGSAVSNAVQLKVKFSPICAENQKWVYGGGRRQAVNVSCEVEGHPPARFFRWAFNTSSEYMDIPKEDISTFNGSSVVTYTPHTHHDFGSLLCWGINDVNVQQKPCVFHVVPAAPPESVHNCSAWHNASAAGEVVVACQAGWSGGLSQTFTLEVRVGPSSSGDQSSGTVLAALMDQIEPHFTVTGLAPGTEYELAIISSNAQGTAKPTRIIYLTPIDVAEKRTSAAAADAEGPFQLFAMTPLLAVLTGVVLSVLLLCFIILGVVIKMRKARNREQTQTKILYDKASTNTNGCDEGGFIQQQPQAQDPQPDIILVKTEADTERSRQLIQECSLPLEESYCDSSSSLLNNGGPVPCETDSLLQNLARDAGRCSSVGGASASAPFHTGSLGRKSYSSIGHETPPVSYTESTYSLRRQKGFHSQDSDCDSAQIPLVMSSQSGTRESCV